jgi:nicotinate (nicotinamide) nucleotide adenylyltransferase
LTRLISNADPASNSKWGYSVPPACFSDPVWIKWLRNINNQLIGAVRPSAPFQPETYESIYKLASRLRLKKYIFPNEPNTVIGFYFGSFNPVHENHIALAEYAHKQLGLTRIVFVPNSDEHEAKKDELLPIGHRISMLEARVSSIDWMSVIKPAASTKRWESKAEIAEDACSSLMQETPSIGVPALLLGQDSWNKAVLGSSRDKTTRHFIGISKLVNAKFFIFPRTEGQDSGQPVLPAPKPIRDNLTVVDGYRDPIGHLSSSRIRQALRMNFLECPEGLDVRVYEYVRAKNLYASST